MPLPNLTYAHSLKPRHVSASFTFLSYFSICVVIVMKDWSDFRIFTPNQRQAFRAKMAADVVQALGYLTRSGQ